MSLELTQIKTAFEVLDMTVKEIAEDRELEIEAVKAALMQCSSVYRKSCGKESEEESSLNFTNEQLERVNEVLFNLAIGAEDESIKLKAAMYVRDDKKGRKEVAKIMKDTGGNIFMFNQMIQAVRGNADAAKAKFLNGGQNAINV